MEAGLVIVSMTGFLGIIGLQFAGQWTGRFEFWPPGSVGSWQHRTLRGLFRFAIYPMFVLTALELFHTTSATDWPRAGIGAALAASGFGLALKITTDMGWDTAFGAAGGLRTTGWFAHSRNPVYVATWLGLFGWGLALNTASIWLLCGTWAGLYALAPFWEEPWLDQQYGDAWRAYRGRVRRFI